ncbi:hypothetical protein KSF_004330 [Reticulibacter mediterranei]|uniref:Uncharacterized protein n=1 Tax=Reticulibacter mediterranei TaxID=2778369 RepID=A0A8J3MZN1_9CHLR|nr:hypothetical protein [Reticulibacter mediterranei]GHO90385.1 hypothetical protein KSF_004330 [Reticulibacter mediterranei]
MMNIFSKLAHYHPVFEQEQDARPFAQPNYTRPSQNAIMLACRPV